MRQKRTRKNRVEPLHAEPPEDYEDLGGTFWIRNNCGAEETWQVLEVSADRYQLNRTATGERWISAPAKIEEIRGILQSKVNKFRRRREPFVVTPLGPR